jgi:hypothetical protein
VKAQVQSLKELYRQPNCWEKTTAPIVRFWTGDGTCWGFPYFSVIGTRYEPQAERLLIYFGTGAIVIRGPKALEFFDDFANHRDVLQRYCCSLLSVTARCEVAGAHVAELPFRSFELLLARCFTQH